LNEILPSSGLAPGPGNLSQNGQKPTPLMASITKKLKTKNFFFQCRLEGSPSPLGVRTAL